MGRRRRRRRRRTDKKTAAAEIIEKTDARRTKNAQSKETKRKKSVSTGTKVTQTQLKVVVWY